MELLVAIFSGVFFFVVYSGGCPPVNLACMIILRIIMLHVLLQSVIKIAEHFREICLAEPDSDFGIYLL